MNLTISRVWHSFDHEKNNNCEKKACAFLTLLFISVLTLGIFPTVCYFKYRKQKPIPHIKQPVNPSDSVTNKITMKILESEPFSKAQDLSKSPLLNGMIQPLFALPEEQQKDTEIGPGTYKIVKRIPLLYELSKQDQENCIACARKELENKFKNYYYLEQDVVEKEKIYSQILEECQLRNQAPNKDKKAFLAIQRGFCPQLNDFFEELCKRGIIYSHHCFKSSETSECYILKLSANDDLPDEIFKAIEAIYANSIPFTDPFVTERAFLKNFYPDRAISKENIQALQQKILAYPHPVITRSRYWPASGQTVMEFNKQIFQETLRACTEGYLPMTVILENPQLKGELALQRIVKINNESMLKETVTFENLEALPPLQTYQTQFSVIKENTFQVLLKLKREGANPVGINMANAHTPGGGVKDGCIAQEENLCRRSNHILGLQSQKYPLPAFGGIYCPHVQVFRDVDFTFFDQPEEVALVAIAAYDLREGSSDLAELELPKQGPLGNLENCQKYMEGMEKKIGSMIREMSKKGHITLVLGALGCGAFNNPPEVVSAIFKKFLELPEFKGRFKNVVFAILEISEKDKNNGIAFRKICEELNAV